MTKRWFSYLILPLLVIICTLSCSSIERAKAEMNIIFDMSNKKKLDYLDDHWSSKKVIEDVSRDSLWTRSKESEVRLITGDSKEPAGYLLCKRKQSRPGPWHGVAKSIRNTDVLVIEFDLLINGDVQIGKNDLPSRMVTLSQGGVGGGVHALAIGDCNKILLQGQEIGLSMEKDVWQHFSMRVDLHFRLWKVTASINRKTYKRESHPIFSKDFLEDPVLYVWFTGDRTDAAFRNIKIYSK
ncbi:MAG: hypothetical protein E3J72_10125 [Planctomycetota bacterium]|nr:MAG: hypothetical protein E3J72_10125 [Planctomycetota bacterium]